MATEKKYACKKMCFVGSLCRVGDIVSEEVASLSPSCFVELKSKGYKAIQDELEEKIPEVKQMRKHEPKLMTNRDILKAKASIKVAGDKDAPVASV